MTDTTIHQAAVPGNVIDALRDELDERYLAPRCWYGMAVTLGKTQFTIADAVELLRSYEADGIYSPETSVIESPLTQEEAHAACVRIYRSEEYAAKRSRDLSEKAGGPVAWTPEGITADDIAYCHAIQDKALALARKFA